MRDQIVAAARECLKTPFVHQGRALGFGQDCAGVLVHIFQSLTLPYIDQKGYPRRPYAGMMKTILDRQPSLIEINKKQIDKGDVLLMRIYREPQHIAIYTVDSIVHSYSGAGEVIEHRLDHPWRKRITHAYQIVRPADVG